MKADIGSISWFDLTIPNADSVRDFYSKVVGWSYDAVPMGEYSDYSMKTENGEGVTGICHARGVNAGIPPVWMLYVTVRDLKQSLADCVHLGGSIIQGERDMGSYGTLAIIKDPAGAIIGLIEPKTSNP